MHFRLLLAGSLALSAAQTPARDPRAIAVAPIGSGRIGGVVVGDDERPLRRVAVSIAGDMRMNRSTVTDDSGQFGFSSLPVGRFTITAEKPGYPPMSYGAKRPYRTGSGLLLAEGQQVTNIRLKLPRGAVLSGTVLDDRGQPMPGIGIMAWELRTTLTGERTFAFPPSGGEWVTSDDRGAYRIFGLPPGEYTVGTFWAYHGMVSDAYVPTDAELNTAFQSARPSTAAPPAAPPPSGPKQDYNFAPVFYPAAVDPLNATTITLAAGEEKDGLDIRMQLIPMSHIEGSVVGPDGSAALADARVVLFRKSRISTLNTTSYFGAGARFRTPSLPPSDYTIMAETPAGPGKAPMWASADVIVSGPEPIKLTLTLQPSMTLTGRVVFDGTALKAPTDLSRVRVSLFPLAGTSATNNAVMSPIDASGGFSISGVTPGRFRLMANAPAAATPGDPAWRLRSVTAGGHEVTDLPIEIGPAGPPEVIVTFTDQTSDLTGTLATPAGQPATDYFVVVLPPNQDYWGPLSRRIVSARPDGKGVYVFKNLPPGDYRIAVTTDLVSGDLNDPNALQELLSHSTPVTIALGEKKTFDIKIGG